MRVLAVDPGSQQSAWLLLVDGRPELWTKEPNEQLRDRLRWELADARLALPDAVNISADLVVIEWLSPRGMPTSAQEFEAAFWAGRFAEAARPLPVERLTRDAVKFHHTGHRARVTDAVIRAALIDRFGGIGGKAAAVGVKSAPGPLYGVHADCWAALAVALAWHDGLRMEAAA